MLITLPTSLVKSYFNTFKLDRDLLHAHPKAQAHDLFSQIQKWKKVILTYVSVEGSEFTFVTFMSKGVSGSELTGKLLLSIEARDEFRLYSITICDYANERLKLYREDIDGVENYDLSFTPISMGKALINKRGYAYQPDAVAVDVNNPDLLYVYNVANHPNGIDWGYTIQPNAAVYDLSTGEFNEFLSSKLSDPMVQTATINNDTNKAYVIGQFYNSYLNQNLPANIHGYFASRLLEIDLITGVATSLYEFPNFTSNIKTLFAVGNLIYMANTQKIICYDRNASSIKWEKTCAIEERVKYVGGFLYVMATNYDSQNFNARIIKINANNGSLDNSLPAHPTSHSITPTQWDITSSGVIVISCYGVSLGVYIYKDNQWVFRQTNIINTTTNIVASSDGFYQAGQVSGGAYFEGHDTSIYSTSVFKFDYDGLFLKIAAKVKSSEGSIGANSYFNVNQDDVYVQTQLINQSSQFRYKRYINGNWDNTFQSPYSGTTSGMLGLIHFYNDKMIFFKHSTGPEDNIYIPPLTPSVIGVNFLQVDKNTGSVLKKTKLIEPINSSYYMLMATSPLLQYRVLAPSTQKFNVIKTDEANFTIESGWPSFSNASMSVFKIDGDYMYAAWTTSKQSGNLNDIDGVYKPSNQIISRVNLLTKKIDRTFDPASPSGTIPSSSVKSMSFTTNYIYCKIEIDGVNSLMRINRSTLAVEAINLASIGISGSVLANAEYCFVERPSNKVLMYAHFPASYESTDNRLNGFSYAILNETTLIIDSYSASIKKLFRVTYNSSDSTLVGYIRDETTNGYYFAKFDIINNTMNLLSGRLDSLNDNERRSSYNYPDSQYFFTGIAISGNEYFMSVSNMLNRTPFNGIVKMSPFGTFI